MRDYRDALGFDTDGVEAEYLDAFYGIVGEGKAPSVAKATIQFLTTPATQREAAEAYDVTPMAIYNNQDRARELLPEEAQDDA